MSCMSPALQNTYRRTILRKFITYMLFPNLKGGGEGRNKEKGGGKNKQVEEEREATKSHHSILPKVTERLNKVKHIA